MERGKKIRNAASGVWRLISSSQSNVKKKKNPKRNKETLVFSVVFSNLLTAMEMPPAPEGFRWKQNGKWNEVKR